MASVTTVATAVVATLSSNLTDVDYASVSGYLPTVQTTKIALIGTALGQQDEGYLYSAGWVHGIHRLRLQFWIKHVAGEEATTIQRARDIGYAAMKVLVDNDVTGGYALVASGEGPTMTSQIDPQLVDVNGVTYVLVTLTVPVYQKETV